MPRRRMLDPDFWTDSKLAKATRDERLFFIGLFSNADDEGRIMASPAYLKSIIFPYDDDITPSQVEDMRNHLAEINPNVMLYQNAGEEYIQLKQWERHQKPRYPKPSKFPPPPPNCNQMVEGLQPNGTKSLHACNQMVEGLQPNGAAVKVSLGKVSLLPLRGFSALKDELIKSQNKVGFLVKTFKAYHAHAPPQDLRNLGGRLAGIAKTLDNDHVYLLRLIWDSSSAEINGSHLDYIQGKVRSQKRKRRVAKVSSEAEIAKSLEEAKT